MVILNADPPDVEKFIWCKAKEEKKAHCLIERGGYEANFNGEAYSSIMFQNANLSVRVSADTTKMGWTPSPSGSVWQSFQGQMTAERPWPRSRPRSSGQAHRRYRRRPSICSKYRGRRPRRRRRPGACLRRAASVGPPAEPGTAVGDLQALEKNQNLYSDFEVLDDLEVQQDVTANP